MATQHPWRICPLGEHWRKPHAGRGLIMKILIPLLLISFFLTSFISPDSHYFLLDTSDFEYMRDDNKEPAISIPDENFKSFNQWQCFDTRQVNLDLAEVEYNNLHQVPSISTREIDFDIDPDINWDVKKVIDYWKDLIQGSDSICIFGAFLQKNEDTSLWYIK